MHAVVDSGNLFRSCISKDFFHRLGYADTDLDKDSTDHNVTTAASGGPGLKVLGQPRQAFVCTVLDEKGKTVTFRIRPVVIENLAMDMNLSGGFLCRSKWDYLVSEGVMLVKGRRVPLTMAKWAQGCQLGAVAYATADMVVEPRSVMQIELRVPGLGKLDQDAECLLNADEGFFWNTKGLYALEDALVTLKPGGRVAAMVANSTDIPHKVKAGQAYGTCQPTCSVDEAEDYPWMVATLDGPPVGGEAGGNDPPRQTAQRRKEAYFEKFVRETKESLAKQDQEAARSKAQFEAMNEPQRRKHLRETFKLNQNPRLKKQGLVQKVEDLLFEFWDLFAFDGDFGLTHLLQHRIVTPGATPIKAKYRAINPALEPDLHRQLQLWLDTDVIEPASSPWAANLVAAKKKGGKVRWCVDYRRLNQVTKKDAFPMPSIEDCINRLAGSSVFSSIDCQGAFHGVAIAEQDREKTAFMTPFGSYQYKRLGFGVTNGPATYCRLVARVLEPIPTSEAIAFLDDGVVHSPSEEDHFASLRRVFKAYAGAGLRLNPAKCQFFQQRITFLGHSLDASGIRPVPEYVNQVLNWKLPRYKTEARSFLGMVGYYRDHIAHYAALSTPWTDVTGMTDKEAERTPLKVTKEMEESFVKLKTALAEAPTRGFPYFTGPKAGKFILDTDFSQCEISGVLSQLQPDPEKGVVNEVPLCWKSKKLNKSQRAWASPKGELYAGIYFMEMYAYYLRHGPEFTWRTDHSALKHCREMKEPPAVMSRFLTTLAEFPFVVVHRAGAKHKNADCLSRGGCGDPPDPEGEDELMTPQTRPIYAMLRATPQLPLKSVRLTSAQQADPDLAWILGHLKAKTQPEKTAVDAKSEDAQFYAKNWARLRLAPSGILQFMCVDKQWRPCLPPALQNAVIRLAHIQAGHQGLRPTIHHVLQAGWFPAIKQNVFEALKTCRPCQIKAQKIKPQRHTLMPMVTGYPFQKLHVDFVGPLNPGKITQSKFLFTVRDSFTRWVEAFPVRKATAEAAAKALLTHVFPRFGFPDAIHSDQGTQFTGALWAQLSKILSRATPTPPVPQQP